MIVNLIRRANGCTERMPPDGNFSLNPGDKILTFQEEEALGPGIKKRRCSRCGAPSLTMSA